MATVLAGEFQKRTGICSASLASNLDLVHRVDSNGEIALCDGSVGASPQKPYGTLINDQRVDAQGKVCELQIGGIAKCVAGAAITRGASVTVNSAGKVIDFVVPTGASNYIWIFGTALDAASAVNEKIRVEVGIVPFGKPQTT